MHTHTSTCHSEGPPNFTWSDAGSHEVAFVLYFNQRP